MPTPIYTGPVDIGPINTGDQASGAKRSDPQPRRFIQVVVSGALLFLGSLYSGGSGRAGVAGFLALAPDGLTPLGGYPGNDDDGRAMQAKLEREKLLEDFVAAAGHLKSHADCTGKVGCVGFCFGGAISNALAVRIPDLAAAVPFYGGQPATADVPKIKAPLLLHYASLDERVNAGWPEYETALKANNKQYTMHMYEGTNHGFHNDTTPRYDEEAAKLAWQRTVAFFEKHLA